MPTTSYSFGGGGGGQPVWIAHAYQVADTTFTGGSVQNIPYSNKNDPSNILDISGGALKFTVPSTAIGIVRVKTKMSPQSSFNATNNFFSMPIVYQTSGLVYKGAGDRMRGTWVSGQVSVGFDFPQGETFFALTPNTQYTVKAYSDNTFVNTGGTNSNGDVNYTVVEIW